MRRVVSDPKGEHRGCYRHPPFSQCKAEACTLPSSRFDAEVSCDTPKDNCLNSTLFQLLFEFGPREGTPVPLRDQ
jgi:hypothetical protein